MYRAFLPLLGRGAPSFKLIVPSRRVTVTSFYSVLDGAKSAPASTARRFEDKPTVHPTGAAVPEEAPKTAGRAAARESVNQLLASLLALRSQDKHREVLDMWRSIRADHANLLNNKVLGHLVSSAQRMGETTLVVEAVEFAVQQNIQPEQGTVSDAPLYISL